MGLGYDKLVVGQGERLSQRFDHRIIRSHAAYHDHRRDYRMRANDRCAEVPGHRVAESSEHFGGAVAFLLGVDHIGLCKDAASSGHLGRSLSIGYDFGDVLDRVLQSSGLLVEEASRPGRTISVGCIVDYAQRPVSVLARQSQIFGGLTAHFEHGGDRFSDSFQASCDGLEFVHAVRVEFVRRQRRPAPGHTN
jgi:hypothetical protein